jgi:hypothetical protein
MATVTSRVPALIDYLVALFTSASSLAAVPFSGTAYQVSVLDGPAVTDESRPLSLFVGWTDPDATGGESGAESSQEWAAIGRMARNETVTIHCCAEAWSGSTSVQAARLACTSITAAVEALMQADTTQFGGNVLFPDPGITNMSLPQDNSSAVIVRQSFDLVFRCRIGGF